MTVLEAADGIEKAVKVTVGDGCLRISDTL